MSRYIRELINLDAELSANKKLRRKLFTDKQSYASFMQNNSDWILDRSSLHQFTKDEIHGFLLFLQKNARLIVKGNKDLPSKFDLMTKRFITEQQAINPLHFADITDLASFQTLFEKLKPEIKQPQIEKSKHQAFKDKEQ